MNASHEEKVEKITKRCDKKVNQANVALEKCKKQIKTLRTRSRPHLLVFIVQARACPSVAHELSLCVYIMSVKPSGPEPVQLWMGMRGDVNACRLFSQDMACALLVWDMEMGRGRERVRDIDALTLAYVPLPQPSVHHATW